MYVLLCYFSILLFFLFFSYQWSNIIHFGYLCLQIILTLCVKNLCFLNNICFGKKMVKCVDMCADNGENKVTWDWNFQKACWFVTNVQGIFSYPERHKFRTRIFHNPWLDGICFLWTCINIFTLMILCLIY